MQNFEWGNTSHGATDPAAQSSALFGPRPEPGYSSPPSRPHRGSPLPGRRPDGFRSTGSGASLQRQDDLKRTLWTRYPPPEALESRRRRRPSAYPDLTPQLTENTRRQRLRPCPSLPFPFPSFPSLPCSAGRGRKGTSFRRSIMPDGASPHPLFAKDLRTPGARAGTGSRINFIGAHHYPVPHPAASH